MAYSKVDICNIAFAHLGADSIRSFDEKNKRARMAEVFFDQVRDYLLAKFDWPFARNFKQLQSLTIPEDEQIPGEYAYQLPVDCRTPRALEPKAGVTYWHIIGPRLWCKTSPESERKVWLYYTKQEVNSSAFSDTFVALLALLLAIRMGPPLTQDTALVKSLLDQYMIEHKDAWESDANIGNPYREYNEDPNKDSFVNPGGDMVDQDIQRWLAS